MPFENSNAFGACETLPASEDGRKKRRPSFLFEAAMIGAALMGVLNLCLGGVDPAGKAVADATRYFVAAKLDRSCSADGFLIDRGTPCADAGGFRFVLGSEGRYEIFAVDGKAPQTVARSGGLPVWTGSSAQLAALERLTAAPTGD